MISDHLEQFPDKVKSVNQHTLGSESILRINNVPRAFAWGKIDGMADRLGLPYSGQPQAELWLGAHPLLPAEILNRTSPWSNLIEWEDANNKSLPYMLKVLAVGHVLSIQTHPGKDCAQAGFARENEQQIPLDAADRNYRDPHPKPELVVALDDHFTALCGFRDRAQTAELLLALEASIANNHSDAFAQLRARIDRDSLRSIAAWMLEESDDQIAAYHAVRTALREGPDRSIQAGLLQDSVHTLSEIDAQYPNDPALLFAVLLEQHRLKRGQALWLPTGTPHAYVSGYAVEIMGPSDNVFRAGLTQKHIDRSSLISALNFDESFRHRIECVPDRGAEIFRPNFSEQDGTGFMLVRSEHDAEVTLPTDSCVLVTDGSFELESSNCMTNMHKGESALLPAGEFTVTGSGQIFFATGSTGTTVSGSN